MNISAIIGATILVAAVGLFIGVFLGVAGKKFAVEVDEKEVAIREALPGNNCGGCGYPGCDGLAAAIAKGEAPVNRCPVGGEPVGKIIAGIMGQEAVETARQVAHVKCSGTCEKAKEEYIYTGVEDCEMLPFVAKRRCEGLYVWMLRLRKLREGLSVWGNPYCGRHCSGG